MLAAPDLALLPRLDVVTLLAGTVEQEASGEPFAGKLGVAMVVVNRAAAWKLSIPDVIFQRDQFSCWRSDSGTRMRLDSIDPASWYGDLAATTGALFRDVLGIEDPTKGALFYLNPELTKTIRGDGTLPKWAADPADSTKVNSAKVLAVIGRHWFLKG